MSVFITDDFLLQSDAAKRLFHDHASDMPIIDYHCHLPPLQVASDHQFENLTQIWLAGDHYKWRAMRTAGIEERFITGDASDWEKFEKWAQVVPMTLRNPLYHWTHLELRRPFGIDNRLLSPETAKGIWDECNAMLSEKDFSARGIMKQMKVRLVCTTDDPIDDLAHHRAVADDASFDIRMLPTFRPDKAMAAGVPKTYNEYLDKLSAAADVEIRNYATLLEALRKRHDYFHEMGCRLSDHGLELFVFKEWTESEVTTIFDKVRGGDVPTEEELVLLQSSLLYEMAVMDAERGWTQQFHIGALRNNNTRMFEKIGPDTGFDSIVDGPYAKPLSHFLDRLDRIEKLPKTILYNLNPTANEMLASMIGNFQDGSTPGKIQFGSGWWFLDQKDGMERQMEALSNLGLLSLFVGMLTDSRSFLSYTRHEYFRRILCNLLGGEMESGILPSDFEMVGQMVRDICYHKAERYFGFD